LHAVRPWVLGVHCGAHRTALAVADSAKRFVGLMGVDGLLHKVHNMFAHSSRMVKKYKMWAGNRGFATLKFPIFNSTRWFSRVQCINALIVQLPMLLAFCLGNSAEFDNACSFAGK
jgi:hypothetical protein